MWGPLCLFPWEQNYEITYLGLAAVPNNVHLEATIREYSC